LSDLFGLDTPGENEKNTKYEGRGGRKRPRDTKPAAIMRMFGTAPDIC
jgi:hypothetical protein